MNKDDLIKLALPISIIIAAVILYLGMTAQYRGCIEGYLGSSSDQNLAQYMCGKN